MDLGAAPVRREQGGPPRGVGDKAKTPAFESSSDEKQKSKTQPAVNTVGRKDDAVPPSKKKQKTTTESIQQERDPRQARPELSRARPPRAAAESSSLRSSPFRIRVGCVVALRCHRTECPSLHVVDPNSSTQDRRRVRLFPPGPGSHSNGGNPGGNWMRVWTDPIPGRDEGLNLIGQRVRAQVPRLAPGQEKTVLEGEVIRLLDCHSPSAGRLPKPHKPLRVELLIDSRQLQHFPFLKRVEYYDAPVGATTLAGGVAANSSASEASAMLRRHRQQKRQQEFEMRIRGHGTDVVVVKLAPAHSVLAFGKSTSSTYFGSTVASSRVAADASDLLKENASRASSVGLSWAVLRLVPADLWWEFQVPPAQESAPRLSKQSLTSGNDKHRAAGAGDARATGKGSNSMASASTTAGGLDGVQSSARIGDDASVAVKRSDEVMSAPLAAEKAAKRAKKGPSSASVVQGVRHMGDGADTADRQVHNWRWFAGRFYDLLLRSAAPMATCSPIGSAVTSPSSVSLSSLVGLLGQVFCGGFIGEVTQIDRTEGDDAQESLARVTIRRLVLPEHTRTGRLPIHENFDVFEDHDGIGSATDTSDALFEIPIEQLIIVGRKMGRWDSTIDATERLPSSLDFLQVSHNYSLRDDEYGSLCPGLNCQRFLARPAASFSCRPQEGDDRITVVSRTTPLGVSDGNSNISPFAEAEAAAKSLTSPDDFCLPADFLELHSQPKPQAQPMVRAKARVALSRRQKSNRERAIPKKGNRSRLSAEGTATAVPCFTRDRHSDHLPPLLAETPKEETDTSDGKETCSRILVYDSSQKRSNVSVALVTDRPRNLREFRRQQKKLESHSAGSSATREDKADSRANRANQRRFMKDAAANSSWLLGMDTLASREPQLRFDRSGIHSWGVYADENIAAGEMIVEYRGELIGMAVTEKREAEYLEAKIGSDYMFRIDKLLCCDATKQGNVARFVNASCDPNCFTKIITLDGTKRIVIYAKRDIRVGEELCYDYKFPLEYDESKRIPCHCGAKDCRGFMNWNKRYIALDGDKKAEAPGHVGPAVAQSSNEEKPTQMTVSSRDVSFGSRTPSPREGSVRERHAEALAEQAHRLR